MMMLADELKPCPYCGKEMQRRDQDDAGEYMVWCENCGAYGPNDITRKYADNMWNMRRPEDALRAENAKLRAALESLRRGDKEHDSYCKYDGPNGLYFCTCSAASINAIIDAALDKGGEVKS